MTLDEKLDHIIKRLDQLCAVIDPYPGYTLRSDGNWYNRITGENMFNEMQRKANLAMRIKD